MSESALGEKNSRFGKKISEETRNKKIKSAKKGEDNKSSKLTNENVFEIRKLHIETISSYKIAKMFNVSKGTILAIINKKTWKHI
jgi:DNA invertase Pin-like site-specific DNA recombinase